MPPGQQPTTTTTTTTTKTTTTTTTQQNQTGMMTNISSGNNVVQPVMAAQNVSQTQTNTYQQELARLKQELGEIKKPSVMMTQQFEAQVYSDSVGAEKRKKKSNNVKSRLYQKKCNASLLTQAEYDYAMQRESNINFVTARRNGDERDVSFLAGFFGEAAEENAQLVSDYQDQGKRSEVIVKCLQKFEKTDLSQIDVRDDATLVSHAAFLEQLQDQARSMKEMIDESNFGNSSDTEENRQYREKFDVTYETVSTVLDYYRIKKQIMRHPCYRDFYNTDISMRYSENNTVGQRELTFLLWQAQACLEKLNGSAQIAGAAITLNDNATEAAQNHQMLQNYLRERGKKTIVSEKIPQELKNDTENYHTKISEQIDYLEWKYQDRFLLLTPEQMIQNFDSIQKDFAPLQEMSADMEALQKSARAFENTEENRILRRKLAYYTGVWQVEQKMYEELQQNPDMSYAQYRRKMAEYASGLNAEDIQSLMQTDQNIDLTKEQKDYPGKQSGEKKLSRTEAYYAFLKRNEFIKDPAKQIIVLPKTQLPQETEKKIQELSGVLQKMEQLSQKELLLSPEEREDRKMNLFRAYQGELERFVEQNRSLIGSQAPAGTALSEIEKNLILSKLKNGNYKKLFLGYERFLKWKGETIKENSTSDKLQKHMNEVEKQPQELPREADNGLSEEQIAGIHAIDQWMFRNMARDGLTGSTKERYVCELMKRPLRERLLSYYIVEKGQYNNPNAATTICSQSGYIPDLNAFKNRMVATKWKFWMRRNGGQIYWNKLDLAFEYASKNRNMVHTFSLAKQEEQKLKQSQSIQPLQQKAMERQKKYEQFLQYASDYREFLEKCSGKPDAKKQYMATQKQAFVKLIQTSLRELIELDEQFPKEKLQNPDEQFSPENEEQKVSGPIDKIEQLTDPVGTVTSGGQWISTEWYTSTIYKWELGETVLKNLNLASGILGSVSGLSSLVNFVMQLRAYNENKKNMGTEEKNWARAELVDSISGFVSSAGYNSLLLVNAGEYASAYASSAKEAVKLSSFGKILSTTIYATIGVSAGIQIAHSGRNLTKVYTGRKKLKTAAQIFQQKKNQRKQQSGDQEDTRQEEYEQGILHLADKQLHVMKLTSWWNLASNAAVAIGFLPLGELTEPIANLASIGLSIAGSIHEYFAIQNRNEEIVDEYLKVTKALKTLGLDEENKTYRKQVRKELLARYGFSGTASFFAHVAKRYAQTVYRNLFYTEHGEKLTRAEYEKNKDAYKSYVAVAESMGFHVRYPETPNDEPHPSEDAILEKFS